MDEILFGAAYYPEYMPYDRIDTDISMMRKAGMNIVRIAESTWSTLEPVPGTFNFDSIDRTLDAVEKAGMKAIIGTPTYAVPAWLAKKDPKILVFTKEGRALYGHRQIFDITNKTFLFYAQRIIETLIGHTASRKCVAGFQLDNETKHYGNAGEHVQQLFKKYLQDKFHTTDAFNRAFGLSYWSNSIADWDDLADMRGCINGGLAAEFERFQRSLAADYLRWQSQIVDRYRRADQFITHNFDFEWKKFGADIAQDGYSYGVQPDIDHSEAAQCLSLAGADIYHPTQDSLTGVEIAFCGDEIRTLKQKPYLVLECQAQAFKYWTPYPGQLRLHAYSHLASGALGLMYWNWHSIHNGYETYWKGLLSHDLVSNPTYEEACVIGNELLTIGKEHLCLSKENRVALVVDNAALTAFKWFPIDKDLSYNDVVHWMYDSLFEMNIECDIVHADELRPEQYSMIVTPALYCAKESLLISLRDFVGRGGILVSSFKSFVADEKLSVYPDTQPHLLHDCFGMSYNQFTEPGSATLSGKPLRYFAELLKPEGAETLARYEHKYWGKYAGITKNTFGKGSAYHVGCFTDKETLKSVFKKALADAKIDIPASCWPVIIKSGVNSLGRNVHYILHYSQNEDTFISPYRFSTDRLTGKTYQKGELVILHDWDAAVLEEK